jgi:alkanesulfonate monooxygenase SsuD/methylene tetrahydromethanopterin reductase-like flavin-dependent oxidoreductase (luciferase family)
MRAPSFGASTEDLYAAALEMCSWAESRGAGLVILSEHHGADDGHLPSPLLLAAAIAGRTEQVGIVVAAVVLPFCDEVRLAEEMCVLDIISGGRVMYVLGVGHRAEEYEHFGIDKRSRGRISDEKLDRLLRLLRTPEVDLGDRTVRITPRPLNESGPTVMIGGGSTAAARRAGRHGLGLMAQANPPGLQEAYESACRSAGHEPGFVQLPNADIPTAVFVADDVDHAWAELGTHLLHDARTAASYRHGDTGVASISQASTVDELREAAGPYRVLTVTEAVDMIRTAGRLPLLPLCGGLEPRSAWPYLERAVEAVELAQA